MNLQLTVGIVGMLFILIAFILDEFYKEWRQNSIRYNVFNIIGAGLLLYYAFTLDGWPFVILNAVWMIVALVKLVQLLSKR